MTTEATLTVLGSIIALSIIALLVVLLIDISHASEEFAHAPIVEKKQIGKKLYIVVDIRNEHFPVRVRKRELWESIPDQSAAPVTYEITRLWSRIRKVRLAKDNPSSFVFPLMLLQGDPGETDDSHPLH